MKSLLVLNPLQLPKPFPCPKTLNPIQFPQPSIHGHGCRSRTKHGAISLRQLRIRSASSNSVASLTTADGDAESAQLFEKLKDAERQRINELEELEKKVNIQLERQLVMASYWSRALLTMRGKLKGTEWDPENSHRIDFSDFLRLLNSNNVQFMEYSNYGQTISVILPYYKDEKMGEVDGNSKKEIIFRRHVVDQMPIDCWNDVWQKLFRNS